MTIEFDFSKLKDDLDEPTSEALDIVTSSEVFTGYLSQAAENRLNAAKESFNNELAAEKSKVNEFRETNLSLTKSLEEFKAVDLDEYGRLKALGSDTAKAAEKMKSMEVEHAAQMDGLSRKVADYEKQLEQVAKEREAESVRWKVMDSIREWNTKNPQLAVQNGAEDMIAEMALNSYKTIDDKTVMQHDGKDFTTDGGFGTISEWIGGPLRESRPFLFTQIAGSGASGSNGGGVTKKFSEMTGAEKTALYDSDPEKYERLKNQG